MKQMLEWANKFAYTSCMALFGTIPPLERSAYLQWEGTLESVQIAEAGGVEMHQLAEGLLIEGVGIDGDRYATHRGHYSHLWHPDRQVTLIACEVIDQVAAAIGQPFLPVETRRNLATRGVPVNDMPGTYFAVGEAVLYGGRLNIPCRYFERLIDKPVFEPLLGISGLNCQIIRGGVIRPGDIVRPLPEWDESRGRAVV
jgi:MOSC domain-containing protein YiiM